MHAIIYHFSMTVDSFSPHVQIYPKLMFWSLDTLLTFVSTTPCSLLFSSYACLHIMLLCFSFKRVFGTSLTEETRAIDQDPENTAGKYFIDKKYSYSFCYFVLQSIFKVVFKPAFYYFHAAISPRNLRKSFSRFNFL